MADTGECSTKNGWFAQNLTIWFKAILLHRIYQIYFLRLKTRDPEHPTVRLRDSFVKRTTRRDT